MTKHACSWILDEERLCFEWSLENHTALGHVWWKNWSFEMGRFSSVQSLSHVWLFVTPWISACRDSLSITNSRNSPKLMSIKSVMPSSHLILFRPLLLPPVPSSIRVFSNESTLNMRWPKYYSFSFSIIPSKEIPGLSSFRMEVASIVSNSLWLHGL